MTLSCACTRLTELKITDRDREQWRCYLEPARQAFVSQHSCSISPIVYDDMVVLGNDQGDENHAGASSVLAVDHRDGALRWKLERRTATVAYSTPCVYRPPGGQPELIFNSEAHGVTSIDPASGQVNWEVSVFKKRSVSSTVIACGLILGSCGSGGGGSYLVAVRPPSDVESSPSIAYKLESSTPYVPTPLALGELAFVWSHTGIVTCVRAATGATL